MGNTQELNHFIIQYGYLAIFLFVFLQELGIPNPLTNELILMFSGYLTYTGALNITTVFLVAVSADFIGTSILYFVFYGISKHYIFHNTPPWLIKLTEKLKRFKQKIDEGNRWTIFMGRLTPFLRGYVSVAAGTIQIKPTVFLKTVLFSAITWSGGLVLAGRVLGPYWNEVAGHIGAFQFAGLIFLFIMFMLFAGRYIVSREFSKGA